MKALKTIGIILAAIVALILVLGLIAPKDVSAEKSIVINAPTETVFPYLQYFDKLQTWSPWNERDPNMTSEIIGTDGAVGAINRWKSKKEGNGEQEITELVPNEHVTTQLRFEGMGSADAKLTTEKTEGGTKVTWAFQSKTPFPWNVMNLFVNFSKSVGNDFESGLNKLKTLVEKEATMNKKYNGYEVQEIDSPAHYFFGLREQINMDQLSSERYAQNLPKVFAAAKAAKLDVTGTPCGLFFLWDDQNKKVDLAYAVAIKTKASVKGFDTFEVPAGKLLVVDYYGPYNGTGNAHMAMDEYLKEHNLEAGMPVWEQYITDPMVEPDTSKWLTKVYYPVKSN